MLSKLYGLPLAGLILTLLTLPAILFLSPSPLRLGAALLLICFLPGLALVEGLFSLGNNRPSLEERILLGLGAAYVVTIVGELWLFYLNKQLTLTWLLTLYLSISLFGFGLSLFKGYKGYLPSKSSKSFSLSKVDWWWLAALLIFAAYFRFYFLSYSDYRGDEAEIVLRAIAAIRGSGDPILSHTKGPSETLTTAALGLLYGGVFNELAVRIPFAIGNCLAVVSIYFLAHKMFNRKVAIVATALVAINGWFVTYGRTAQYQNLVLPTTILAVWCYWQFYKQGKHTYHLLGSLFLAVATFGHYEGAAAGPAVAYLLVLGLLRPQLQGISKAQGNSKLSFVDTYLKPLTKAQIWPAIFSMGVGAIIVFSFYIPFIFNPAIEGTQHYLSNRVGGTPPYNNWELFYINGLYYNSMYYVLGVVLVLLAAILRGIKQAVATPYAKLAMLIALPVLLLSWPGLLPAWVGLIIWIAIFAVFLFSSRVSVVVKTNLLWIVLPFVLYIFGVIRPGNHYYVYIPPLMLLTAFTMVQGYEWLKRHTAYVLKQWGPIVAVGIFGVLYGLSTWHQQVVFLRTDLEYLLTYPQHRNPVFWSDARYPFTIRIGWGFPYRLGWQTVGELYRQGELAGSWYGTDENNSIYWYTLGSPRNPCYPQYYMLTELGYEDVPLAVPEEIIEDYYSLKATVRVNNQPRLQLYSFNPEHAPIEAVVYDEPRFYATQQHESLFGGNPLGGPILEPEIVFNPPHTFKPHPNMLAELATVYDDPNTTKFQEQISLLGYDLDEQYAKPGGIVILTLYWQADTAVFLPYKVFTHLEDDEKRLWAQADDEPACSHSPTYTWRTGNKVMDRHVIFLPDDIPPGQYSLQVGLYEIRSSLRLDLLDSMQNPAGNALTLPAVTIKH